MCPLLEHVRARRSWGQRSRKKKTVWVDHEGGEEEAHVMNGIPCPNRVGSEDEDGEMQGLNGR